MRRSLRWFMCAFGLHAAVVAADFDTGLTAFEKQDYALALKEWVATAQTGDPHSLKGLGRLYAEGLGVPRDLERAHLFFNLSAFKGDKAGGQARDAMEKAMTPEQIQRAKNQALEFVEKSQFVPADVVTLAAKGPGKAAPSKAPARPAAPAPAPVAAPAPLAATAPAVPPARAAIEFNWLCQLQTRWEDKGSGGKGDFSVFDGSPPPGSFIVGGYAQGNYRNADGCLAAIRAAPGLITAPADWQMVWGDKGSGAKSKGALWVGVPSAPDHICLGAVGTGGYAKPVVQGYGCVHRCLTQSVPAAAPVWTDEGTGAEQPVAVWRLPVSNSFIAFSNRTPPGGLIDINPNATCAAK